MRNKTALTTIILLFLNVFSVSQSGAIQGGQSARGAQFVVAIVVDLSDTEAELCTGGIVAPRLIVTAAHCLVQGGLVFSNSAISVSIPGAELTALGNAKVQQVFIPSGYRNISEKAEPNDIAFIVMDKPVGVEVIQKIADQKLVNEIVSSKVPIRAYGYGITGLGQSAPGYPKTVPLKPIEKLFLEGFEDRENTYINYAQEEFGAICIGDSGGPAVAEYQGQLVLVSVASASSGICTPSLGDDTNWGTIPGEYPELLSIAFQTANTPIPKPTPSISPTPIKKTIVCVKKGKTKKITGIRPKCPSGYVLKKK